MESKNFLYDFDKNFGNIVLGVDEAGRGPWAGPVVAAAVILDFSKIELYRDIQDSKKIKENKREKLFDLITNNCVAYSISEASHQLIDEINILQATLLAMKSAIEKIRDPFDIILVDGVNIPDVNTDKIKCIKDGDAKSLSIAAASILAKVHRDRIMRYFDRVYPRYGFAKHKGYGTKDHINALNKYGLCSIHRKTYEPVKKIIAKGI